MEKKKTVNFGFRGWMLVIYQAIAYFAYVALTNYPLNILADMYGGAQKISTIYTVGAVVGIIIQLVVSNYIGKVKNIKVLGTVLGAVTLGLGVCIMFIPPAHALIWQVCYGMELIFSIMYSTFAIGILVGQWFPRRKGTVMGIATLAFPVANGLIGPFAAKVFAAGTPDVAGAFLPYFIVFVIGWLIGIIFIKDYPEQCGCYRDNDKDTTPEVARAMMEAEIENKRTTVWKIGRTMACRDYWFLTLPMGALLMFAIGMMTQTASIIAIFENQLTFVGGYAGVMLMICIFGCVGSYVLGLLDTKFGTKNAIAIAVVIMIIAGILGMIPSGVTILLALICLALFMGASSNFIVSASAQYWRREDFSSVFSVINPVANMLSAIGPMIVARLMYSNYGYQSIFLATIIGGIISLILICLFRASHVREVDDKYRTMAGKPLDNVLEGRR